jgi:hypothetical protein
VIKPDSASATAAAEEIILHLEEDNKLLRLKLHLLQMETIITSRHQSNDVCRTEENIQRGERWNNAFNLRRD